jgi:transcriptional regulator with XRE-family HTH domain
MGNVTATELAGELGVSKARVSQYVSGGKLDGCFVGDGRARRFDLEKVARALGRKLHPGQMMGNGSQTRTALKSLTATQATPPEDGDEDDAADDTADGTAPLQSPAAPRDSLLPIGDPARYEMARTQKAEEEARRLRRQNSEAEGTYVLASEVARQTARLMAQETAEFESLLRDGARKVADRMGVDFKEVRQVLMETWRAHRHERTAHLSRLASNQRLTPAEQVENI